MLRDPRFAELDREIAEGDAHARRTLAAAKPEARKQGSRGLPWNGQGHGLKLHLCDSVRRLLEGVR